jgi:ubiquinone/menaquinone biosynthesis C-methylase UbiE
LTLDFQLCQSLTVTETEGYFWGSIRRRKERQEYMSMGIAGEIGSNVHTFTPEEIAAFWESNPCGSDFVEFKGFEQYFIDYDSFRYAQLPYILDMLDRMDLQRKMVLEIGPGQGSDARQIIERGAIYTGVDLTEESIRRVRTRFELSNIEYRELRVENAEHLTSPDDSFDLVYSEGVLHHSPRIESIVAQIYRCLKPGGQAVIMLYHKDSLNYHFSIRLIRRLGIFLLFLPFVDRLVSVLTGEPLARLNKHKANLRFEGLSYLKMERFIHKATDGPDNVYSSVWTKGDCDRLFSQFSEVRYEASFLNERHFPGIRHLVPGWLKRKIENRWGWNLLIFARK